MCMQVTNPILLFHRLKINQKSCGRYVFILETGAVVNSLVTEKSVLKFRLKSPKNKSVSVFMS
jgi:hypothetical protein